MFMLETTWHCCGCCGGGQIIFYCIPLHGSINLSGQRRDSRGNYGERGILGRGDSSLYPATGWGNQTGQQTPVFARGKLLRIFACKLVHLLMDKDLIQYTSDYTKRLIISIVGIAQISGSFQQYFWLFSSA
jgi:hypothetical protein